jgi:hypothetical protein
LDAVRPSARERIEAAGYEAVVILESYSYDDALIGVSECNRAVYDFDKMVDWLMKQTGWSRDEAIEWIEYNTLPALSPDGPIIMNQID